MQPATVTTEQAVQRRPRGEGPAAGGSRLRDRSLTTVGAVASALAVWVVAGPGLGVELAVSSVGGGTMQIGAGPVVLSSLVSALAGWGLLAVLERVTTRARPVWVRTALAVAVLSLGGPLTGAVDAAAAVVLTVMHVAVAGVVIPGLARSSPGR